MGLNKKMVIKGFIWNSAATYGSLVLRFLGTVVLARILFPEDFGTVAYITSVFLLATMFAEWGFEAYIVKADKKEQERAFNTVFRTQLFLIVGITLLTILAYPLIFKEASATHLLYFLAIGAGRFLMVLSTPFRGRLVKNMQFGRFAIMVIGSDIIGIGASVAMALAGMGIWSLVVFTAATEGIQGILAAILSWKRPRLRRDREQFKDLYQYSKYNLYATALDRTYRQTDDIAVKNIISSAALGIYNQAYRLSELFSNITFGAFGAVTSSIFGNLKKDKEALSRNYRFISGMTTRFVLFLYLPFLLLTAEAVLFVYGPKWTQMVTVLHVLAYYALLAPYRRILRMLNQYTGRSKPVAESQLYELIVFLIILIPATLLFGLVGTAAAVDIGITVGIIILLWRSKDVIKIQLPSIFGAPILASLISAGLWLAAKNHLTFQNAFIHLAVNACIIAALYAAALIAIERQQFFWMLNQVKGLMKKTPAKTTPERRP